METVPSLLSRRAFVGCAVAAGAALALPRPLAASAAPILRSEAAPVCVFSKHLEWLGYDELAEVAAETGFDGIDLTVRPNAHVTPERVEDDLPKAVEAARKAGIGIPMIVTALSGADDPAAERTLRTAAALGIRYYRMGWLDYEKGKNPADALRDLKPRLRDLADLNRQYGIHGGYQNHAGTHIGAPVWDLHLLLEGLDPRYIGVQYDVRHAVVEGGNIWPVNLRLIAPWVRTLCIKDFRWAETAGKWQPETVPLGQGMVDFGAYFGILREAGIEAPFTLHYEYPMTASPEASLPKAQRRAAYVAAMRRDLELLRKLRTA